jgi:hypothetical protein
MLHRARVFPSNKEEEGKKHGKWQMKNLYEKCG